VVALWYHSWYTVHTHVWDGNHYLEGNYKHLVIKERTNKVYSVQYSDGVGPRMGCLPGFTISLLSLFLSLPLPHMTKLPSEVIMNNSPMPIDAGDPSLPQDSGLGWESA